MDEAPPPSQRPPPLPPPGSKPSKRQQTQRRSSHGQEARHRRRNPRGQRGPRQTQKFKRRTGPQTNQGGQQLGFFGSVPSLQDLQRENRRKTRRHYNPNDRNGQNTNNNVFKRGSTPQMPSAPTPARFPGSDAKPTETPQLGANLEGFGADKLQAEGLADDLDFYGTNEGLVFYQGQSELTSSDDEVMDSRSISVSHSYSEDGGDSRGLEDTKRLPRVGSGGPAVSARKGGAGDLEVQIIRRLRHRVADQDAYIAQLEDDNLRLRERLDLLGEQLRLSKRVACYGSGAVAVEATDTPAPAPAPGDTSLPPAQNIEGTYDENIDVRNAEQAV